MLPTHEPAPVTSRGTAGVSPRMPIRALSPVLFAGLLMLPALASAWELSAGLGVLTQRARPGGTGLLELAWPVSPTLDVDVVLEASGFAPDVALRLAAAAGVRWSPFGGDRLRPFVWGGVVHAHELAAGALLEAPLHAVVGADGHTAHRTGLGVAIGVVARPLEAWPALVSLRLGAVTHLADEHGPAPAAQLLVAIGWRF